MATYNKIKAPHQGVMESKLLSQAIYNWIVCLILSRCPILVALIFAGSSCSAMVKKLGKQAISSEFDSHWVKCTASFVLSLVN